MIGQIDTLHPVFKVAVDKILLGMKTRKWDPIIGSGMRTHEQQEALFAQGRTDLNHVNGLRKRAGWQDISARDNAKTVTNARGGQSNHNLTTSRLRHGRVAIEMAYGFAVDIVDRQAGWEISDKRFWKDLGELAKRYGCSWGGDWNPPDVAHVEMRVIDGAPRTTVVV